MIKPLPWMAAALLALSLAACSDEAAPEAAVSAQVSTVMPVRGSLPDTVMAYGDAVAAAEALQVLSVQAPGRMLQWQVVAGMPVRRGQPLGRFALAPSAVAAYAQAESTLALAQAQRAHAAQLFAQQLATRDQLAQADAALRDAQANRDALLQQQGRADTVALVAPYDGTVASIEARLGDNLAAGAPLLSVQRSDGLVVSVGLERRALARVQPGAAVTLTPIDGGASMHGLVRRVAHALNPQTHQLDVEIVPDGALLAGESFRAAIEVGQWQGWLLPRDAVLGDDGDRHVFQLAQGKAVRVPVQLLGESDTLSVVNAALDARRPLVTVGASQLDDGMAVRQATAQAQP